MTDMRIQFSEEMVGAGHTAKADTLNRLSGVEHNNDGTHSRLTQVIDPWIDVRAYGAIGDGTTDDSNAIQNAINAWAALDSGVLFFPPKKFKIGTALTCTFSANRYGTHRIEGYGATILHGGLTAGTALTLTVNAVVRYIDIVGLKFDGEGTALNCLVLDGGSPASKFFYHSLVEDVKFEGFLGNGLKLTGSFFESQISRVHGNAPSGNTTGYPILIDNGATGAISSLEVISCTTVHGKYGLYVKTPVSDVKMYGGTYLQARDYGVYYENVQGGEISGVHVENNWQSAVDLASGGPGLYATGGATLSGIFGTTNAKQKYVVGAYAGAGSRMVIIGGKGVGSTVKYGTFNANASGSLVLIGMDSLGYDMTAGAQYLDIGNGRVDSPYKGKRYNFLAYGAAVTPNLALGSYVRVGLLTGDITVNAPAGTPSAGDELVFFFKQDSTGGRTITFATGAGAYAVAPGWTPAATLLTRTIVRFTYDSSENRWFMEDSGSTGM